MSVTSLHSAQTDQNTDVVGIVDGTEVLTMLGYQPICELAAGDRIITRRGVRILQAITTQTVTMKAIRISQNALGFSKPAAELLIPPGQEIRVHDWRAQALFGKESIVLPIERLIDDKHITQDQHAADYQIHSLQFDTAEVIYVDGVEMVAGASAMSATQADLVAVA